MIGRLSGILAYRADDHVLIDVRGVGYVVYCSSRTMAALPGPGEPVSLFTEMLVREDLIQLYGFPTLVEKEWHRLLTGVQGVGAKVSLAILGALGPDGVSRAIALGDWAMVKAAKGVGPKTAQRIVLDLKDKAPTIMAMSAPASSNKSAPADEAAVIEPTTDPTPTAAPPVHAQSDAMSALTNLGYGPSEAASAVAEVLGETPDLDSAALIRAALRKLAPAG
ncbi:Holliday junction branch migration protein RuvA [Chachezhania antarctica]|uniref:Holliday junction branch migration protein RuvA n=1 Tax=Chachezhania antarctica TaxID=2340860 RepID=UPI000EAD4863|nr:Holliday junction branch migration protein RuvA [Chachezhania antarctica]|tara:strand:+ start:2072 stop:2737 length:666 start_codon:yes stop_codon:yes gene_type:complete